MLRTYPSKRPRLPFAPHGECSVARASSKVFLRARRLIYIEDQYLWSREVAGILAEALRREPELRLSAAVLDSTRDPREPRDPGGRGDGASPSGRALAHRPGRVQPWAAWWAWPLYQTLIDPDGRPLPHRRARRF